MDKYVEHAQRLGQFHILQARGGMVTVRERAVLGYGEKSLVKNIRCWHPGYETRNGYTKLNTTAYNASQESPMNIHQFVKGKIDEKHLFVQFGDGDLKEAANAPPSTGTTFGDTVHNGTDPATQVAAFTNINDFMVYANGTEQHQIYGGEDQPIGAFHVVKDSAAHDTFPSLGEDYWEELTDLDSSTVAVLDSLGDLAADHDAIYVMTRTPIDLFTVTVSAANGTASTLQFHYWSGSWTADTITDNTASGGASFAQSGTIVPDTAPTSRTDEIPRMMFGQTGFWYRLSLSAGDFDAEVEITEMTYDQTTFVPLVNVWNGLETSLIEAHFDDDSAGTHDLYSTSAITLDSMTSSDALYVASADQLEGIFFNFGSTPNLDGTPTITVQYWDGSAWANVTEVDGTNTFLESGWIWWGQQTGEFKRQFKDTRYYAYWYKITVSTTLSDSVTVSLTGMPYFDINRLGRVGKVCATWKNRALYTFDKYPRDIYVSEAGEMTKLNGADYALLQPGDGRDNATTAIVNFHNEIMVFQEEKGAKGGCVTIFEGYSPATFGKLVISTQVGTFSPKTVAVVDGSKVSTTKRDLNSQTQVFFLSHYGVFMSDGRIVTAISDDIQNYFDPRFTECLRRGYENECWLEYDSTENVIKLGIVSGSSATTANKYFIYDLTDGVWYEDDYATEMSVMREVEADSGQFYTLVVGAGCTTGFVYHMNNGTNDDGTAVSAEIQWEFNNGPFLIDIEEVLSRVKVQGAGTSYSWTAEESDVQMDSGTGSMVAKNSGETMRRNRHLKKVGNIAWSTFKMTSNTKDKKIYLYDLGIITKSKEFK